MPVLCLVFFVLVQKIRFPFLYLKRDYESSGHMYIEPEVKGVNRKNNFDIHQNIQHMFLNLIILTFSTQYH